MATYISGVGGGMAPRILPAGGMGVGMSSLHNWKPRFLSRGHKI